MFLTEARGSQGRCVFQARSPALLALFVDTFVLLAHYLLVQLMDCPLEGETFDPLSTFVNLCQDLCQSVPHFALNLIDIESGGSMPKNVPSGSSSAFLRQVLTCKSLRSKSQSANSTEAARLCQAMQTKGVIPWHHGIVLG